MTFTLRLFDALSESDDAKSTLDKWFSIDRDDLTTPLIQAVKEKLKDSYSTQIEDFKSNIRCPSFKPIVPARDFFMIKDGLILDWVGSPSKDTRPFVFISLGRKPLDRIATFFNEIGKMSGGWRIHPLFSPEEEILEPYSKYLRVAIAQIHRKNKIQDLVYQGILTYENRNYAYCINTIGLAFEEQLTQIYETLFRVKCPSGLTIGALLEAVKQGVKDRNPNKDKKESAFTNDFPAMYTKINSAIEKSKSSKIGDDEILSVLRDMLTLVKENSSNLLRQVQFANNGNNTDVYSIFPTYVSDCMEELLRLRNIISHRSRTSVGTFEATKALYDITLLSVWWNDENRLINWDDNPDNIIHEIVARNCTHKMI